MPRDASGTYTTPAGQPVTGGTAISAAVFNALVSDLASEMTDSLSRSGKGGMSVPIPFADGNVSAPAISFTNETASGLYRAGAHDVRAAVNGADYLRLSATRTGFATGSPGQQISTSSNAFTHTGDTNDTDVTNATVTITTTGRPVLIWAQSDGSTNRSRIGCLSDAGGDRTTAFKIKRGVTLISETSVNAMASTTATCPPGALLTLDAVAAGTYTYKLQVAVDNALATAYAQYVVLVAFEL